MKMRASTKPSHSRSFRRASLLSELTFLKENQEMLEISLNIYKLSQYLFYTLFISIVNAYYKQIIAVERKVTDNPCLLNFYNPVEELRLMM
jgi:hypothetical protein